MNSGKEIEAIYRSYLESALTKQTGKELSQALRRVGLHREGQALEEYFEQNTPATDSMQGNDWDGRRCFVGPHLPSQAKPGDVWLDIVELTPMILVVSLDEATTDLYRWVSLHPVYVWQFRTFLHLADVKLVRQYFMKAADLFDPDRFTKMSSMEFVTNVYHEEAVAYAHWFGKYLCGQFELQLAEASLKPEEFLRVLPPHIRLWDEAAAHSEFARIAVGRDSLYKDPDAELDHQNDANKSLPDRMLYDEWERTVGVGFSTLVAAEVGLLHQVPRMAYEFIELQNAAPRP